MRTLLVALLALLAVGAGAQDSWEARRQKLGTKEEPYRILVDKVLMASNDWQMTPAHVAEIKAAGFNVVVPRTGADDNGLVEQVARRGLERHHVQHAQVAQRVQRLVLGRAHAQHRHFGHLYDHIIQQKAQRSPRKSCCEQSTSQVSSFQDQP